MTAPAQGRDITYEQYVAEHAVIAASLIALFEILLAPFRAFALTKQAWLAVLALMYPFILDYRRQSAELAREFYDSERRDKTGDDEPYPIFLAEYDPDWFQEAMEPSRKAFSVEDAPDNATAKVIAHAIKEVENSGRRTILRAVEVDPLVKGWARVEGGGESCAFCTMLISRGPVYSSAETAGLNADDTSAVELFRQIENAPDDQERARAEAVLMGLMTRWHENCDCKVVPVFKRNNWPGIDQYRAALELWKQATKDGAKGRDALNALRRLIHRKRDGDEEIPLAA